MYAPIEIENAAIPCVVKMSSAYASEVITHREYNTGLRVAVLEDLEKKPIYVATWSRVMVGDIVLMPFYWPDRNEARIAKVRIEGLVKDDSERLAVARFTYNGLHFGQAFGFDDVAYVQSRF